MSVILMKCVLLSKQNLDGLNCILFFFQLVALSTVATVPCQDRAPDSVFLADPGNAEHGAERDILTA